MHLPFILVLFFSLSSLLRGAKGLEKGKKEVREKRRHRKYTRKIRELHILSKKKSKANLFKTPYNISSA